jgi:hypothetical protein
LGGGPLRLALDLLKPHETKRGYDSQDDIKSIVERFARPAALIRDANPADKAEIYKGLNLVLTYQPEAQTVYAEARQPGFP